jgi:hypothetical protein
MFSWRIPSEELMWIEVYSGAFFLLTIGLWAIFRKIPIAFIALLVTVSVIGLGGFREPSYNSDTWNYNSYVNTLAVVQGSEVFVLTKLEPVHAGLILLLRNFEIWLLAEAFIQIGGLCLAYRIRPNDASFLALCAFVLTLSSSALRFSGALIFFYWLVCRTGPSAIRAAQSTIALCTLHVSMLMGGPLMQRRPAVLLAVTAGCVIVFFEQQLLGSRAGLDLTEASKGIKTLAIAMGTLIWIAIRGQSTQRRLLPFYAATFLSFFLVASQVLPTFNRFLIMGTLVVLLWDWPTAKDGAGPSNDFFERSFTVLLAAAIVAPYVVNLPQLFYSGLW